MGMMRAGGMRIASGEMDIDDNHERLYMDILTAGALSDHHGLEGAREAFTEESGPIDAISTLTPKGESRHADNRGSFAPVELSGCL